MRGGTSSWICKGWGLWTRLGPKSPGGPWAAPLDPPDERAFLRQGFEESGQRRAANRGASRCGIPEVEGPEPSDGRSTLPARRLATVRLGAGVGGRTGAGASGNAGDASALVRCSGCRAVRHRDACRLAGADRGPEHRPRRRGPSDERVDRHGHLRRTEWFIPIDLGARGGAGRRERPGCWSGAGLVP